MSYTLYIWTQRVQTGSAVNTSMTILLEIKLSQFSKVIIGRSLHHMERDLDKSSRRRWRKIERSEQLKKEKLREADLCFSSARATPKWRAPIAISWLLSAISSMTILLEMVRETKEKRFRSIEPRYLKMRHFLTSS